MRKRLLLVCLASAAIACAQYAAPPEAYSITQINSMFGPPATTQVYRDGSKALVDVTYPPAKAGDKATQVRTLYDLEAHTNLSWTPNEPSRACGSGTFSGDWGDPFKGAAELTADLAKQHATQTGTETVNGLSTKVLEFTLDGATAKSKVWIEPKYGLIVRLEMAQGGAAPKTMIETKGATFAKPPASLFVPPAGCTAAPSVPMEEQKIAAETGGPAADFADATHPPGTKDACAVIFHVVRAGSMAPVTGGFQLTMEGKPLTVQNGTARIDNAPQQFNFDLRVPSGGATALIYRQCAGPQTTLLLVVKNWENLGQGADWLWVKSGKLAGH
jgi:hypothetical protein